MGTEGSPDIARPTDEIVDVLIIGAGASGAAVAWSLAETRMNILCLEQGDWIKSTRIPEQRPRLGGAPLRRL
jgi:choline dehydrogenase-like flavoprotein